MKLLSLFLSLCLALAFLASGSSALSTTAKSETLSEEEALKLMEIASKITETVPEYKGDESILLAQMVQNLKDDKESMMIVEQLKSGALKLGIAEDVKNADQRDLVVGMINIFDELKALEVLFQDSARAVEEVFKDGMLGEDEEQLNQYRQNPEALKDDMLNGLYISFIYVAHVAGYL